MVASPSERTKFVCSSPSSPRSRRRSWDGVSDRRLSRSASGDVCCRGKQKAPCHRSWTQLNDTAPNKSTQDPSSEAAQRRSKHRQHAGTEQQQAHRDLDDAMEELAKLEEDNVLLSEMPKETEGHRHTFGEFSNDVRVAGKTNGFTMPRNGNCNGFVRSADKHPTWSGLHFARSSTKAQDQDIEDLLSPLPTVPRSKNEQTLDGAISIQLNNFLTTLRRDHAQTLLKILAAIKDLENRVCRQFEQPRDSDNFNSRGPSIETIATATHNDFTGRVSGNTGRVSGKSISADPVTATSVKRPKPLELHRFTTPLPQAVSEEKSSPRYDHRMSEPLSRKPVAEQEVAAAKTAEESGESDENEEPVSTRSMKKVWETLESVVSKAYSGTSNVGQSRRKSLDSAKSNSSQLTSNTNKSIKSSNKSSAGPSAFDSLPSGLQADAKISELQKYQTDLLMRNRGYLDNGQSGLKSPPSGDCSSHLSQVANSDIQERAKSPESNGEIQLQTMRSMDIHRRVSLSKGSNRFSLESLRQQNDVLLLATEPESCMSVDKLVDKIPSCASGSNDTIRFSASTASLDDLWNSGIYERQWLFQLPWVIFRLSGIIPWRQRSFLADCYSLFLFLLAAAAVVYPLVRIAQGEMVTTHICSLPFTVSGLLGALSLRRGFSSQLFTHFPGPLELYALKHGFATEFLHSSLQQLAAVVLLWLCVAVAGGAGVILGLDTTSCPAEVDPLALVCFLIGSVLFAVLLYCQLHVICVLGMMVDRYCVTLFPRPSSCQTALSDWNLIQAMLRQIAAVFDFPFMITQTGACAALLFSATRIFTVEKMQMDGECGLRFIMPLLLPPVLLALGAFLVFFKAATVSEKCSRVAPLVNSMTFDDRESTLDPARMYIVHFITSSGAGFYIQEVRITASMAMKLMYVTGLGVFALLTKLANDSHAGSL